MRPSNRHNVKIRVLGVYEQGGLFDLVSLLKKISGAHELDIRGEEEDQ